MPTENIPKVQRLAAFPNNYECKCGLCRYESKIEVVQGDPLARPAWRLDLLPMLLHPTTR
jgi:hypothetical protein